MGITTVQELERRKRERALTEQRATYERILAEEQAKLQQQLAEMQADFQRQANELLELVKQRQATPRRENEITRMLREDMHPSHWAQIADPAVPLPKTVNPKWGLHAMSQILSGMIELHNQRVGQIALNIDL